jgi:hypothetical protein
MSKTQLLCSFTKTSKLVETVQKIQDKYNIVGNRIFVLENEDDDTQLILTYNVVDVNLNDILESTISVHRKKYTNTIYTINALNQLIMEYNGGILDKKFKVNWEELENSAVVIAYGKLKIIPTTVREIIHLEN